MSAQVSTLSPFYPYVKATDAAFNFSQYAEFPRKICEYLLDVPSSGYAPIDNNAYPRTRLWKYLYYDGSKPLSNPLPTAEQKMQVLFDPCNPDTPPTEKGYRLIPQQYIKPAQTDAQTRIYVYMGRTIASQTDYTFSASVVFDIFTHYTYELNTHSGEYSRSGAIAASLMESLNGVNMTGVGTFSMMRRVHPDAGTRPIFDGDTNVGVQLIMGLEMATTARIDYPFIDTTPIDPNHPNIHFV